MLGGLVVGWGCKWSRGEFGEGMGGVVVWRMEGRARRNR
jgi:hypothetical protein